AAVPAATPTAGARTDLVAVRRRGAGTDLPPNA
ncbi:Biotin synthase, partial [Streptomyces sparsogenes DSM 40356]